MHSFCIQLRIGELRLSEGVFYKQLTVGILQQLV